MLEVQVPEPARDMSDGAGWMTSHLFGVTVVAAARQLKHRCLGGFVIPCIRKIAEEKRTAQAGHFHVSRVSVDE
jgi:hypothetical protein